MKLSVQQTTIAVAFAMVAAGAHAELVPARITPAELQWTKMPNGAQRANMASEDTLPGMYVYRTRFPANFRNQPHFHPDHRVVTIMSGTLYVGYGESFDESQMKALPAGSIFTEPAKQPHYVWAKDGEVVIQVIGGNGPSAVILIPPKQ